MESKFYNDKKEFENISKYYDNYSISNLYKIAIDILKPEKPFYYACIIYSIAISLLSLAIPVSIQTLITTVANTAITNQVVILAVMLFTVLCLSGVFNALQVYLMELFERKFFARISSEITLQNIYAEPIEYQAMNRTELVNRYFDIMTVQKNLPSLLIGLGSLGLNTIVGLILVSSYHFNLAMFNLFFLASLFLVWKTWKSAALRSALSLSNAKYRVAQWHEEVAIANNMFKSKQGAMHGVEKSEYVTQNYMDKRKKHFKFKFCQIVSLLFIYALFSSLLLGIGGVLVIEGQLTLGQLVASELILAGVFYGFSQASSYLKLFYDLIPALEKISHFYKIKTENISGHEFTRPESANVNFDNVKCKYRDYELILNFEIKNNEKILISASSDMIKRFFIECIQNFRRPDFGTIFINDEDIANFNQHSYRKYIKVIDTPHILEDTIEGYLKSLNPQATDLEIKDALKLVKLDKVIATLPDKLQTKLISLGHPLAPSETLRLKLASCLLSKPSVLVLTELFDMLDFEVRKHIIKSLNEKDLTLIYFSNRQDIPLFSKYMHLTFDKHSISDNISVFEKIDYSEY